MGSKWCGSVELLRQTVAYRGGGLGLFKTHPEFPKALQNHAKISLLTKTAEFRKLVRGLMKPL